MRKMCLVALAAVGLSLACGPSYAADMPVKAPAAAAPIVAPSWTGFYAGGNLGYGWGDNSAPTITGNDAATTAFIGAVSSGSISPPAVNMDGIFGGLQLGYNYQIGSNWLVGIETDFQWSNVKGSSSGGFVIAGTVPFNTSAREDVQWFGTVRGRLGYLVTPNWLLYGTGGYAYGRVDQQAALTNLGLASVVVLTAPAFTCLGASVCASGARSDTRGGWTAGGGLEFLLPGNTFLNRPITLKAEYLYVNLGSENVLVPTATNPAASFTAHFSDTAFHTVRAGFNVKF